MKSTLIPIAFNNTTVVATIIVVLMILFSKKMRASVTWRGVVTPLASIIGSGFLISTPLLVLIAGKGAIPIMLLIVLIAYALGSSLRYNILHIETLLETHTASPLTQRLSAFSRPILGVAYLISVVFYIKLLSAFSLAETAYKTPFYENILTTAILLFIALVGRIKGLLMLENFEIFSVNIKLSILCALIVAHLFYNAELLYMHNWTMFAEPSETLWQGFRETLGLLLIIQGFETVRFLGYAYNPERRVKSMKIAQIISGIVYVSFAILAIVLFNHIDKITETTIIELTKVVSPILPYALIVAAVFSQFSAAIADTIGSAGLLNEASERKLPVKSCYMIIGLLAIIMTWTTNIFDVISIASKAFAAYYAIQLVQTLNHLDPRKSIRAGVEYGLYSVLLLLMVLVILLGVPVE